MPVRKTEKGTKYNTDRPTDRTPPGMNIYYFRLVSKEGLTSTTFDPEAMTAILMLGWELVEKVENAQGFHIYKVDKTFKEIQKALSKFEVKVSEYDGYL